MKIGLPRALIYWKRPYFWESFWKFRLWSVIVIRNKQRDWWNGSKNYWSWNIFQGRTLEIRSKTNLFFNLTAVHQNISVFTRLLNLSASLFKSGSKSLSTRIIKDYSSIKQILSNIVLIIYLSFSLTKTSSKTTFSSDFSDNIVSVLIYSLTVFI